MSDEVKKRRKELNYRACHNCKHQIDVLRTCKWQELGGDGKLHLICPRWKRKEEVDNG